jgi:hypothetical protein
LLRPQNLLELDSWYGASTLMIYSELTDDASSFTSVDIERRLDLLTEEVINDPRARLVFGDDLNLSIYDCDLPTRIDFLFIDTLHELHHLQAEWQIYKHLCSDGALIVLDDIYLENLMEFWQSLTYPKLDISSDCHESGFGMFIYKEDDDATNLSTCDRSYRAYDSALRVVNSRQSDRTSTGNTRHSFNILRRILATIMSR